APDGFVEWALENGAVQKDEAEWRAYVRNGYRGLEPPDGEEPMAE
ncbi:hypothetical protein HN371_02880, partial [Candidatus Poribacteria bacterium]|nr:hypothetical protein [Candidatus Poribacteria bacterium]